MVVDRFRLTWFIGRTTSQPEMILLTSLNLGLKEVLNSQSKHGGESAGWGDIRINSWICSELETCVRVRVRVRVRLCSCIRVSVCLSVCLCTYVCLFVRTYVCMYEDLSLPLPLPLPMSLSVSVYPSPPPPSLCACECARACNRRQMFSKLRCLPYKGFKFNLPDSLSSFQRKESCCLWQTTCWIIQ